MSFCGLALSLPQADKAGRGAEFPPLRFLLLGHDDRLTEARFGVVMPVQGVERLASGPEDKALELVLCIGADPLHRFLGRRQRLLGVSMGQMRFGKQSEVPP